MGRAERRVQLRQADFAGNNPRGLASRLAGDTVDGCPSYMSFERGNGSATAISKLLQWDQIHLLVPAASVLMPGDEEMSHLSRPPPGPHASNPKVKTGPSNCIHRDVTIYI